MIVYLNVVIRRESAYVIEERVQAVVDYPQGPASTGIDSSSAGRFAAVSNQINFRNTKEALDADLQTASDDSAHLPTWVGRHGFRGLVFDRGVLTVRSITAATPSDTAKHVRITDRPIDGAFLSASGIAAGVAITNLGLEPLSEYRSSEGLIGGVVANFVPGSGRPVPVIVTARDWSTGRLKDFVICRVRLNYRHTLRDLSRMGLRRASWLLPLIILSTALAMVYAFLAAFCVYLGHGIVTAVNALSVATQRVGQGDLSVRVAITGDDQLGRLGKAFNEMTTNLSSLQQREREAIQLRMDVALASEIQEYLTPTQPAHLRGATVWSTSTPARRVGGDLHQALVLSEDKVGLICADVSGKGVSSALVMAHLQGLVHAYLCGINQPGSPAHLAELLNAELCHRLPTSRYATLFYGEADLRNQTLTYVNAGHASPLMLDHDGGRFVREGDMPLGLFADATFVNHTLPLTPNSTLVVYTDGVTDALNSQEEQFGEERLLSFCKNYREREKAVALGQALRQEIIAWSSDVEQFDDATVLVLSLEGSFPSLPAIEHMA